MQNDARYTLIGAFFLIVVTLGTLFLFWAARWSGDDARKQFDVVFEGTVSGLTEGAPVLFNGIRVGEVLDLSIDPKDPRNVLARISVEAVTPVKADTEITLEYQGLTGVASVALEGGSANLPPVQSDGESIPLLTAKRSAVQDLLESARDIMGTVEKTAKRLDTMLAANEQIIGNTMQNLNTFSEALAKNSDQLETLVGDTSTAASEIAKLSKNLNGLIETNRENLDQIIANARQVTGELASEKESIGTILSSAATATENLSAAATSVRTLVEANSENLSSTITNVQSVSKMLAESEDSIERILANLEKVSVTIGEKEAKIAASIDNFEKITGAVAAKDEDIQAIIADAAKVTNQMVSLVAKAESVLGSVDQAFQGDSANFFQNASAAAESFRRLTERLEVQTNVIASDISKFTGGGLRDLEALIAESRGVMRRLDRTLSSVEDNPQRFIFGGDEVKKYAPR